MSDTDYATALGERLRNIRVQKGMSLQDVQQSSRGKWKAAVVGAYERGDRNVTVARLSELAAFYGVPVSEILPEDGGSGSAAPDGGRIAALIGTVESAEARKVEASGRKVRYLNIGDPIIFGFQTPPHLVDAVARAIRDGHNGYAPSVGIPAARGAVAAECVRRGMPLDADRVVITAGTSEGIELALTALAEAGDEETVLYAKLDGVRLINESGVANADGDGWYIRDGIIVVPKGAVVTKGCC